MRYQLLRQPRRRRKGWIGTSGCAISRCCFASLVAANRARPIDTSPFDPARHLEAVPALPAPWRSPGSPFPAARIVQPATSAVQSHRVAVAALQALLGERSEAIATRRQYGSAPIYESR